MAVAAPKRLGDPGGVQSPNAAVALGTREPPPFATQRLMRGEQLHAQISLGAAALRWVGPNLIAAPEPRADELRGGGHAKALGGAKPPTGTPRGARSADIVAVIWVLLPKDGFTGAPVDLSTVTLPRPVRLPMN